MTKKILVLLAATFFIATSVSAHIKVIGRGDDMNFDTGMLPAHMKPGFTLMNKKCSKCHSMEMVVTAVLTGKCPETKQPFDKQAVKAYGIRMIRKKDSDINKKEMRDIVVVLNYLLDEQSR